jgi:hypothetical protein
MLGSYSVSYSPRGDSHPRNENNALTRVSMVGDTGFEPVTLDLWRHWILSVKPGPDQHLCETVSTQRVGRNRTHTDKEALYCCAYVAQISS